jgi:HEPN domain-containing protein
MKPLTLEWIQKAEGDFASTQRELRARKFPNYDAACFHAQQCVEKYLKARLQEADIPFGKSHDLTLLLDLALPIEPLWDTLRPQCRILLTFTKVG